MPGGQVIEILSRDPDGGAVLACADGGAARLAVEKGDLAEYRSLRDRRHHGVAATLAGHDDFDRAGGEDVEGVVAVADPDDVVAGAEVMGLHGGENLLPGILRQALEEREGR